MLISAGCKINLGLNILGKRTDGFHDLESVFYPIPWNDLIEIVPSNIFSFTTSGLEIDGNPEDNLIVKAYKLMVSEFNIPNVKIHLHKQIPFGAGLGGGSSDATATLILLNKLFKINLNKNSLQALASQLGSDCPFFVENIPVFASATGTHLSPFPLNLAGYYLVIVKPEVHISTSMAYGSLRNFSTKGQLLEAINLPIEEWKGHLKNDFEVPIFDKFPELQMITDSIYSSGAIYASMSGSGSAIFGLYNFKPNLEFLESLTHKVFLIS